MNLKNRILWLIEAIIYQVFYWLGLKEQIPYPPNNPDFDWWKDKHHVQDS